ncbi:hypothetical protein [Rhizobium leguminosarum]|uniref:hypothetical protein n=1 Tax=Rhizobium leguminosarum TaxID=384 RepID=UPI0014412BB3|nr:hypothetical protein [Rhizobium leguminosarum]MBY5868616.1 hypothetical protein [Rhizobium leguminosarum]NKM08206.1 hypothetical protein [Rhizobium leguminosarum bv. viciae]
MSDDQTSGANKNASSDANTYLSVLSSLLIYTLRSFEKAFKYFLLPIFLLSLAAYTVVYAIYFFIPTDEFGASTLEDDGGPVFVVRNYAASYFQSSEDLPQPFTPDATFVWVRSCPVPQQSTPGLPMGFAGYPLLGANLPPLLSLVNNQGGRLRQQIEDSRQELLDLRTRAYVFLTVSAIIGFFTTVVAATNAWAKSDIAFGSVLRLLGVVLPALGTLATALASIYAPVDTVSRKAQLVSGLISLQGELGALLAESNCEKAKAGDPDFSKAFADWNKRFSAAMAAAEFSQGPTITKDANSEQKKPDNSGGKGGQEIVPANAPAPVENPAKLPVSP